jgi:HSP20 family protein
MTKDKPTKSNDIAPAWPFNMSSIDRVFDNFRREFEQSLLTFPAFNSMQPSPTRCDVADEGDKYVVKLDVPGVKKDEIKLHIHDSSLEVSAKHEEEEEEQKKNYVRKERNHVSFYRLVPLPQKVASNKAQAKLSDGVLKVTIPKETPTRPQTTTIQVQ